MVKKIKRSLSYILSACLLVAILISPTNVYASSGLAVSAGKDFGDGVDTRQDAIDASTAYDKAGYSTVTFESPTKSDFTSTNLKADILFLSGHGSADVLSFGTFKFVCQSGTANSNYTNLWNTTANQKLITFAGCNTAGGDDKTGGSGSSTDSITKRAVDRGADVAVGWTSKVSAGSHTNWLKRYNDALANGKSVSQAISSANSYIYVPNSGVKNVVYYGNGDLTITSSKSSSVIQPSSMSLLSYDDNKPIINEIVKLTLTNQSSFDTDAYRGYIFKAEDGYIVDVYYKSHNVLTNVALTLSIDDYGDVKGLILHNINTQSLKSISNILARETVTLASDSLKDCILRSEKLQTTFSEEIVEQTQFEYYDFASKTTYLVTFTEVIDEVGAISVLENLTPVK